MKGTISGTVSLNVLTGAFTADGTGVATHLGKYTVSLEGAVAITPDGGLRERHGNNRGRERRPADRDLHVGDAGCSLASAHTTTIVMTVTGGTGRFSDASGTLTAVTEVSPISFGGGALVNSAEGTVTGADQLLGGSSRRKGPSP